jgi:hypothetical protein
MNTVAISLSIIGSTVALIRTLGAPIRKILKLQKNQTNGITCLLRRDILDLVNKANSQGFICETEIEELRNLYENYKNLDGNGVVDRVIDSAFNVPMKNKGE